MFSDENHFLYEGFRFFHLKLVRFESSEKQGVKGLIFRFEMPLQMMFIEDDSLTDFLKIGSFCDEFVIDRGEIRAKLVVLREKKFEKFFIVHVYAGRIISQRS